MDTHIRNLLLVKEKVGGEARLNDAFTLLRSIGQNCPAADQPEAFGHDLYVICAENAIQFGGAEMASECLRMYFAKTPPANQFLCRAYLCLAQIRAPTSADNAELLEDAMVYLVKAIKLAKENPRYHFLIYNASVLFWKFARPFLKPNYRCHLAGSLHQVVKALDDIDDADHEWRAQLMIALIECHMDSGQRADAASIAAAAASFVQQFVPAYFKTLFGLIVQHQLMDASKLDKMAKSSAELAIYYRICKLKIAIKQNDGDVGIGDEIKKIVCQLSGQSESLKKSLKEKVISATAPVDDAKSKAKYSISSVTSLASAVLNPASPQKPHLLVEVARLAVEQDLSDVAADCLQRLRAANTTEQSLMLETEFLECTLMVSSLATRQESYQKSIVEVRLAAVRRCDEALSSAIRAGLAPAIQAGCATQWNLCLPLLQANLRKHVRRPLTAVADALEKIQSLLISLRCEVHTELAKCEEDQEQIQVAVDHLRKALALDDGDVYQERLQVALRRLQLRAQLYELPERAEDQAAMMVEQARKSDSGTMRMKRSLLVRAGEALAPDAFLLVLESENDTRMAAPSADARLSAQAARANQHTACIKKVEGHMRRLGDRNDRERAAIWGDLAKTARKQEVWDVCRIACRFCLLYDDRRWRNKKSTSHKEPVLSRAAGELTGEGAEGVETQRERGRGSAGPPVPLYDKDLVRLMAEVNFINGEALIHLLRSEGVELGDAPIPSRVHVRRRSRSAKSVQEPAWIIYCSWIESLSELATSSFARAIEHAADLGETWLVCCAATYLWNYSVHAMQRADFPAVAEKLETALEGLKRVGYDDETTLLVHVCTALARGLLQPWLPPAIVRHPLLPDSLLPAGAAEKLLGDSTSKALDKGRKSPGASKLKVAAPSGFVVSADAGANLKRALEVCEYGMAVTNGSRMQDIVSIATRQPLLEMWVATKQMLQLQVGRGLGTEDETSMECQRGMTRAIVAVRMLELSANGVMEFKDAPTLSQTMELIEAVSWADHLTSLQLWVRLAHFALTSRDRPAVATCVERARGTQAHVRPSPPASEKASETEQLLSLASLILGQSVMESALGKISLRRHALQEFLNSADHARNARNAELVITAVRRYWNAALPLVSQPIERELLMQPIRVLLECLAETTDFKSFLRNKEDDDDDDDDETSVSVVVTAAAPAEKTADEPAPAVIAPVIADISWEDDLALRVALYGVLFQCYADKGQWKEGLNVMDQAIADMPRTKHRLTIFKQLVLVKAKLGADISASIQKFKDESDEQLSQIWRRVALSSGKRQTQMTAYMNAIEALSGEQTVWQKIDYLIEFGEWLYCAELPLTDVIGVLQWALDLLLDMRTDGAPRQHELSLHVPCEGTGKRRRSRKGTARSHKSQDLRQKDVGGGEKRGATAAKLAVTVTTVGGDADDATPGGAEVNKFIPVEREVVIGVLPSNIQLTLADLWDVQQLEYLCRVHTLLAQMYAFGTLCKQHSFSAYSCVLRIWQVVLRSCSGALQDIASRPPPEPSKSSAAKAKAKKDKEKQLGNKKTKPVVVKEKPKRKGALDVMPQCLEEWAQYDVPDEVLDASAHELMKRTGINEHTFVKPTLTLHYLDVLVEKLHQIGYGHLNLTVLALSEALSRGLVKSEPLNCLVHLRAHEVCLQLNLMSGCDFHQFFIHYTITEEEQARCRQESAQWEEKRAQVAKEEQRMKQNLDSMRRGDLSRNTERQSSPRPKVTRSDDGEHTVMDPSEAAVSHFGQTLGTLELRDIWAETADVLMRNGVYQPARELLNEAMLSAQAFGDLVLQSKVMYLFAKLAYNEAQYGQAVNLCLEAQSLHDGDEMFWFGTISLMAECYLHDYRLAVSDRSKQASSLLKYSVDVFKDIVQTRPNKVPIINYILAKLQAKLGIVEANDSLLANERWSLLVKIDSNADVLSNSMLEECEDGLQRMGREREAMRGMNQRVEILLKLAGASLTSALKHTHYIKAVELQAEAVRAITDILLETQELSTTHELRHVSLPAQREAAAQRLESARVLLDIFEEFEREKRVELTQKQEQSVVLQIMEDLTRETPVYTEMEKKWLDLTSTLPDQILIHLQCAHSLVGGVPALKAKVLLYTGRCLRIISLMKDSDKPLHWEVDVMMILRTTQPSLSTVFSAEIEPEEVVGEDGKRTSAAREVEKYIAELSLAEGEHASCVEFLTQATECLCQALNLALQKGLVEVAKAASLELVECVGEYDPSLSSQLLALHQSCSASCFLERLLLRAAADPHLSQTAALLRQRANLSASDATSNAGKGAVTRCVTARLDDTSVAHSRLKILPNHLDLLKEFPPTFTFLILQHSPDMSRLYGAVMDRNKAPGGGTGKVGHKGLPPGSRAHVVCAPMDAGAFSDILSRYGDFKVELRQHLLRTEYQNARLASCQRMVSTLDDVDSAYKPPATSNAAACSEMETKLEEDFRELIEDLTRYLGPVMSKLDIVFRPPVSSFLPPGSSGVVTQVASHTSGIPGLQKVVSRSDLTKQDRNKSPKLDADRKLTIKGGKPASFSAGSKTQATAATSSDYIVLLLDEHLLQLPLEALPVFQDADCVSLSRDISLQMFYHRFHVERLDEAGEKAKKEKDKSKPLPRIPGQRDASKKLSKIIPLDRVVPSGFLPVDTHAFRYIVDPHVDCPETEPKKPIDVFNVILEEYAQQFTPRWLGIMGDDHTPSQAEYETYMLEGSAFIFYGCERFLAYLPPHKLAATNLSNCHFVMLLDQTQTGSSFSRQSKIDVNKRQDELDLEQPFETAMLLSLAGVNCLCANLWHGSLAQNATRLESAVKFLLTEGATSGQAMLALQRGQSSSIAASGVDAGAGLPVAPERPLAGMQETAAAAMVCYGLPSIIVTQIGK